MNPTRSRFTDTVTLTLAGVLGWTLLFGDPNDEWAHWLIRVTVTAAASTAATGWWHRRHG